MKLIESVQVILNAFFLFVYKREYKATYCK